MHELCWCVWGKRQAANISWLRVSVEIIKLMGLWIVCRFYPHLSHDCQTAEGNKVPSPHRPLFTHDNNSHTYTIGPRMNQHTPMHQMDGQLLNWEKIIHWVLVTMLTTMINILICDEKFRDVNLDGWHSHINHWKQNATKSWRSIVMGSGMCGRFGFYFCVGLFFCKAHGCFYDRRCVVFFIAFALGEFCVVLWLLLGHQSRTRHWCNLSNWSFAQFVV